MKRSQLQRKTPLRASQGLTARVGLERRTPLTAKKPWNPTRKPMAKGGGLAKESKQPVPEVKKEIQALLRRAVVARDGGCVLRHYPGQAGACGGYAKVQGYLILQAEHLVTRASSRYYDDLRNVVCLCQRHHIHFKPQHSRKYWSLIRQIVGEERWNWVEAADNDKSPFRRVAQEWRVARDALAAKVTELEANAKNDATSQD